MKKILLACAAVLVCAIGVMAQKVKQSNTNMPFTQTKNVGEFSALNAASMFNVYISEGNSSQIEIKANQDILKFVEATVEAGELKLRLTDDGRNDRWNHYQNLKVDVYLSKDKLSSIKASGAVDIYNAGTLKADNLVISASGSSDVKLNLQVSGSLTCNASGASDIELRGEGNEATATASGSSDLDMKYFKLKQLKAKLSGASDGDFYVTESAELIASGSSDIKYYGAPKTVNVRKTGAADIKRGK